MLILLLGKNGQLGWELNRTLRTVGDLIALGRPDIDFTNLGSIHSLIKKIQPNVIFNATAYTAVDHAESEPERALAINAKAPGLLAEAAKEINAVLIHYSTNYVFDGKKEIPYVETDSTNPINVYGKSKLEGEHLVTQVGAAYLILRTSWVYSLRGDSFVTKVLGWSRKNSSLRIVSDQVGSPTWARMLAQVSAQLLAIGKQDIFRWAKERKGVYHLAGEGITSRLQFAQAILDFDPHPEEQVAREILPSKTIEFPTPAQRPLFTALDCDKFATTFGLRLPPWEKALGLAMDNL